MARKNEEMRDRLKGLARAGVVGLAFLTLAGGCRHKRMSMRPVFVGATPAVVVPDCPTGDCAGATTVTTPAFSDEDGVPSSEPVLIPNDSPPAAAVAPPAGDEPSFRPSSKMQSTDGPIEAPPLVPPRDPERDSRRPATPKTGRASLRTRLSAQVNDPNDLFQPPKADRSWRYIVLHHSKHDEGSYAEIDREHRAKLGTAGCGYHFVIGNGTGSPDGQIEVAQRWSDQKAGAHCRDAKTGAVNDYGIGICLVGNLDESGPTEKQVEAARDLVAYLRDRYQIPAEKIGTHAQLAMSPTACPGKHFPTQAIVTQQRKVASR